MFIFFYFYFFLEITGSTNMLEAVLDDLLQTFKMEKSGHSQQFQQILFLPG